MKPRPAPQPDVTEEAFKSVILERAWRRWYREWSTAFGSREPLPACQLCRQHPGIPCSDVPTEAGGADFMPLGRPVFQMPVGHGDAFICQPCLGKMVAEDVRRFNAARG